MSSNGLHALPPSLTRLAQLTHLAAGRNQLTGLPPGLGGCTSLVHLGLSHNLLTALPSCIGAPRVKPRAYQRLVRLCC